MSHPRCNIRKKRGAVTPPGSHPERSDMKFQTVDQIIEFAIEREKSAVAFYLTCAEKAKRPEMKAAFHEMADEEKKHVIFLTHIDQTSFADDTVNLVNHPKMETYIVDKPFQPNMSYQELLQLAIHREAASYHLYHSLLEKVTDQKSSQLLQRLAKEELKHKERLENEYNTDVLKEN
jgi:rubrerythrin